MPCPAPHPLAAPPRRAARWRCPSPAFPCSRALSSIATAPSQSIKPSANASFFSGYLGCEFDAYLASMAQPTTWGDELTLVRRRHRASACAPLLPAASFAPFHGCAARAEDALRPRALRLKRQTASPRVCTPARPRPQRALSDALRLRVLVITSDQLNWLLRYEPEGGGAPKAEVILSYEAPVHYNSCCVVKCGRQGGRGRRARRAGSGGLRCALRPPPGRAAPRPHGRMPLPPPPAGARRPRRSASWRRWASRRGARRGAPASSRTEAAARLRGAPASSRTVYYHSS